MNNHDLYIRHRSLLQRILFAFILLVLIYKWHSNVLFTQLSGAPVQCPKIDNFFWLLHILRIPQLLVSDFAVALTADLLFFIAATGGFIFSKNRLFPLLFLIIHVIHTVTFNSYACHPYHFLLGPLFAVIPFIFRDNDFSFIFRGLRYYVLFIMFSAALWKILRGSPFHAEQMELILKSEHLRLLALYGDTLRAEIVSWLISHSRLSQSLFAGVTILQFSFITGFFTKRYDGLLFLFLILFVLGSYIVMGLYFFEFLILGIALFPWHRIFKKEEL